MSAVSEKLKNDVISAYLAKGEFICAPDDLLKHSLGVLCLFPAKEDLEQFEREIGGRCTYVGSVNQIAAEVQNLLSCRPSTQEELNESVAAYQHLQKLYALEEERQQAADKNLEMAKRSLRSLEAQNAWLHQENAESSRRHENLEKQIADLQSAEVDNERRYNRLLSDQANLERQIMDLDKEAARTKWAREEADKNLREAQTRMRNPQLLFHPEALRAMRREVSALSVAFDGRQVEYEHARSEAEKARQHLDRVKADLEHCGRVRINYRQSIEEKRASAMRQVEGLSTGTGMTAETDDRRKRLEARIKAQEDILDKVFQNKMALRAHQMVLAAKLTHLYVRQPLFLAAVQEQAELSRRGPTKELLQYLLFADDICAGYGEEAEKIWRDVPCQVLVQSEIETNDTGRDDPQINAEG